MKIHTISDKIKFIERCFGSGRVSRNNLNFDVWCPICNHSDHSKKKLSIKLDDDKNHCWVCGFRARSLIPLLRKFGTQEQLNFYVETFISESEFEKRKKCILIDVDGRKQDLRLPDDFTLLATHRDSRDPDALAAFRYLFLERGLSERDLWYFKFGISNEIRWHRRILMPSFDDGGVLNYYIGRSIDRYQRQKYDNVDHDRNSIIFNEINVDWTQPLVLCEGPFDLTKCGENAAPLLGSELNEESKLFETIVRFKTPIIIALDADMIEKKVPRLVKKLLEYSIETKVIDFRLYGKNDPGEMSKDEFLEAKSNAYIPSWDSMLREKLKIASRVTLSMHI